MEYRQIYLSKYLVCSTRQLVVFSPVALPRGRAPPTGTKTHHTPQSQNERKKPRQHCKLKHRIEASQPRKQHRCHLHTTWYRKGTVQQHTTASSIYEETPFFVQLSTTVAVCYCPPAPPRPPLPLTPPMMFCNAWRSHPLSVSTLCHLFHEPSAALTTLRYHVPHAFAAVVRSTVSAANTDFWSWTPR